MVSHKKDKKNNNATSSTTTPEDDNNKKPISRTAQKMKEKLKELKSKNATSSVQLPSNFYNKQRTLLLSSRGILAKHRHLMKDLSNLLPHIKKEGKIAKEASNEEKQEDKHLHRLQKIEHIATANKCPNILYFETNRESLSHDLFLWLAKTSIGPSLQFKVENISTMNELNLIGNCLKYSRPLLHFDKNFDGIEGDKSTVHLPLIKELLTQVFSTPFNHPKSKPFFDHIFSFYYLDGRVWFRNYQIVTKKSSSGVALTGTHKHEYTLVEIGPRFVLELVKILSGSFDGRIIYNNDPNFVSKTESTTEMNEQIRRSKESRKHNKRHFVNYTADTHVDEINSVFYQ
ncbi:hypothetical protein ABK040_005415 [Willaertia magna]